MERSISAARGAIFAGEGADRVAQHIDVVAEAEIKARKAVGDHRTLLPAPETGGIPVIDSEWSSACQRADATAGSFAGRAGRAHARSISAAGAGMANKWPCNSSQPASRRSTRCASVYVFLHGNSRLCESDRAVLQCLQQSGENSRHRLLQLVRVGLAEAMRIRVERHGYRAMAEPLLHDLRRDATAAPALRHDRPRGEVVAKGVHRVLRPDALAGDFDDAGIAHDRP